ncbi:DUF4350 domain-containing protein [Agaribacterium haliotis]|uniref:DUF4350 domain-containing protein n=1 Tax=Agaribacterium haliotis TaxID=2013869 RepID=UPI000BB539F8|nr:DUF4350 domain-containing protein [Agaribacterium haliotis]
MNNRSLYIVLTLLALLLIYVVARQLEWREQTLITGFEGEAQRSRFYAADLFLAKYHADVERLRQSPSEAGLYAADALLIPDASYVPRDDQQQQILSWLAQGGHLIIGTGWNDEPNIIKQLGFSSEQQSFSVDDYELEREEEKEQQSFSEKLKQQHSEQQQLKEKHKDWICAAPYEQCHSLEEPKLQHNLLSQLVFEAETQNIYIHPKLDRSIIHEQISGTDRPANYAHPLELFYWAGDSNGIRFVQAHYGEGLLTVMVDSDIFSNNYIAHYDHALLLSLLVSAQQRLLILEGKHSASLATLLRRHYSEALITAAVLLLTLVWHLSLRFGAVHHPRSRMRRARRDALRAAAQWHWRRGNEQQLLASLREQVLSLARRRWPSFSRWHSDTQYHELEKISGLSKQQLSLALEASADKDEQKILNIVQLLQQLRKTL